MHSAKGVSVHANPRTGQDNPGLIRLSEWVGNCLDTIAPGFYYDARQFWSLSVEEIPRDSEDKLHEEDEKISQAGSRSENSRFELLAAKIIFGTFMIQEKMKNVKTSFPYLAFLGDVCYHEFLDGPHRRGQEYFLRRMHKLHTYVNAKIVFRVGSELLMFRAHDGHHYLPGGHLEYGEQPLAALQRELLEEMGYTLPAEPIALGAWTHVNDDEGTHRITVGYLLDLPAKPNFQWIATDSSEGFEEYVWVPATRIDDFAMNPRFRRLLHRAADFQTPS